MSDDITPLEELGALVVFLAAIVGSWAVVIGIVWLVVRFVSAVVEASGGPG